MSKAVYGLYSDPNVVQRAVEELRRAGLSNDEITIISGEPFEEYEFSHHHKETWLYYIAGFGGLGGLCFGAWLTSATERAWPINVGGMPIVPWFPNTVVTFELTMLAAILSTVVTLLITTKLPRRQPKLYDPAVSNGQILVGVESPRSLDEVKRLLTATADSVNTVDL